MIVLKIDGLNSLNDLKGFEEFLKSSNFDVKFDFVKKTVAILKQSEVDTIVNQIKEKYPNLNLHKTDTSKVLRKVLILNNLDCVVCANKIETIARQKFNHESIVVDFITKRFIIETSDSNLLENLSDRVYQITKVIDKNIEVTQRRITNSVVEKVKVKFFLIGLSIFILAFGVKNILKLIVLKGVISDQLDYVFAIFTNGKIEDIIFYSCVYLVYLVAYFFMGYDVVKNSYNNIIKGRLFDENFLIILSTVVAFIVGFYDEALFILLLYRVGDKLQDKAINYSRESILDIVNSTPKMINLETRDGVIEVEPDDVVINDIIIVKTGQVVPFDGVVVTGEASCDNSMLTGESIPVEIKKGEKIYSGSMITSGNLRVRVNEPYINSTATKIVNSVLNSQGSKSKTEKFMARFALYYTPIICTLAVIIALVLPFIHSAYEIVWVKDGVLGFRDSIRVALVFLVISCPCALVISIPLSYFAAIGAASKIGILIKGSSYIDEIRKAKTVILDKTGTITEGKLEVVEIKPLGEFSADEILYYAAHSEINSSHPIAKALVKAYNGKIEYDKIRFVRQDSNIGVDVKIDKKRILIGKLEFLTENGIEMSEEIDTLLKTFIAIDGVYAGYFSFKDKIKPKALTNLESLKSYGINRIAILSGDSETVTKEVSKAVNVNEYYSEKNPYEKAEIVSKIKEESAGKTIFVGDGLNDAIAISQANVGIVYSHEGNEMVNLTADVVFVKPEISKLVYAIALSKRTYRIVVFNIVLALLVKVTFLIISTIFSSTGDSSILNSLTIYEAMFADVGVALLTILFSMTILKFKIKTKKKKI